MKSLTVIMYVMFFIYTSHCQTDKKKNMELDFWVGEWDLKWINPKGDTIYGKNNISYIMNGKVLFEEFEQLTGENDWYKGQSWTVKSKDSNKLLQTWTDNNGAYSTWESIELKPERVVLESQRESENGTIYQRMEFVDIETESFTWRYGYSLDKDNWRWSWIIYYSRKE